MVSPLLRSPNRFHPAPLGGEVRADAEGFLTVTPKGIAEDFAQDLSDEEKQVLTATQTPTAAAVFGATITTAAWKTKPSWYVIASNDRAVPPELQEGRSGCNEGYIDHCSLQSRANCFLTRKKSQT